MIHAVETEAFKELHHFRLGAISDDDIAPDVEEHVAETHFDKSTAKVRAPMLTLAIQGRNEDRVGIDLQRRLPEVLGAIASAQVEYLEPGFLQGQLHDPVADDMNVVADHADDNAAVRCNGHAGYSFSTTGDWRRCDPRGRLEAQPLESRLLDCLPVELSGVSSDRKDLEVHQDCGDHVIRQ